MDYLQTDEGSAVEATKPTADATSPDDNWAIKVYKSAVEGKPGETVAKDLSREEDVREILGWLNTKGWILLKLSETWNTNGTYRETGSVLQLSLWRRND